MIESSQLYEISQTALSEVPSNTSSMESIPIVRIATGRQLQRSSGYDPLSPYDGLAGRTISPTKTSHVGNQHVAKSAANEINDIAQHRVITTPSAPISSLTSTLIFEFSTERSAFVPDEVVTDDYFDLENLRSQPTQLPEIDNVEIPPTDEVPIGDQASTNPTKSAIHSINSPTSLLIVAGAILTKSANNRKGKTGSWRNQWWRKWTSFSK